MAGRKERRRSTSRRYSQISCSRFPSRFSAELGAVARHASIPRASLTSARELRRAAYSLMRAEEAHAARAGWYCAIREDRGQSAPVSRTSLRLPFRSALPLRWSVAFSGSWREVPFDYAPGIAHLYQMRNLLLDSIGGLLALCFHELCPDLVIEAHEIVCHLAALLAVKRCPPSTVCLIATA